MLSLESQDVCSGHFLSALFGDLDLTMLAAYDIRRVADEATISCFQNPYHAYVTSKVMAHVAADTFVEEENPAWDVVKILPGYTMGYHELDRVKSDMWQSTNCAILETALGRLQQGPKLTAQSFLDDVAQAHIAALDPKVATAGKNLLIAGNGGVGIPWDAVGAAIALAFPQESSEGVLGAVSGQEDLLTRYDVQSSEEALGYKFSGMDVILKSVIDQYLALPGKAN